MGCFSSKISSGDNYRKCKNCNGTGQIFVNNNNSYIPHPTANKDGYTMGSTCGSGK